MKPANDSTTMVHDWLFDHGIDASQLEYSPAKDRIKLALPLRVVERMLDSQYSVYKHEDGHKLVRMQKWSIPRHLHTHIDVIQPTTSFLRHPIPSSHQAVHEIRDLGNPKTIPLRPRVVRRKPTLQECSSDSVTPLCLRKLYGTFDYIPSRNSTDLIGMANYKGESSNISDIMLYLERYRPGTHETLKRGSFIKFHSIAKGVNNQIPKSPRELAIKRDQLGNLMAETILGVASLIPLTVYSTAGISPWYNPD